ncbi:diguanylate cyclase [Paenibacillus sp. JX-17]|uniref:Diguanylate cyclase n=1 Tax=Paenibacillus lacisoli TaxID=3064525 RepID=A0ABT9CKZ6_9BACL|nr:diguanylate cyclase [Paenibacillus sp. JX-17]MDO7908308.1 diguanylate cyclase [Paenibacillus sp. JX-17]
MSESKGHHENELLNRTLLTEGDYVAREDVDLTNCEKEPIHIPGMIQPHGILLAATLNEGNTIVQCSRNTDQILGIAAEKLLHTPLADLIGSAQLAQMLQRDLTASATADLEYVDLKIKAHGQEADFFGIVHESEGLLILEIEPLREEREMSDSDFGWIRTFFGRLKQTSSRVEASQAAAEQIKEMLGYDRVMIYEFDEQWNGKVIAEAREAELEPFLGHHYPASDIPKQARALYLRNWLRTIVDVNYTPVEIIPTTQPLTGRPLNLSLSVLRSVSPLHIEYLHNMGVGATTTISLIHDNELWGLITCHHYSPKYVPHRIRNLCNFLGAFFSSELYQRQQLDDYQAELQLKTSASRLASIFVGNHSSVRIQSQLQDQEQLLLDLMNASGAVVSYRDKLMRFGDTPEVQQIRELAGWLARKSNDYNYHTSKLSLEFEPARAYKEKASGVLYLALSPGHNHYIMWFRPEVLQIVDWAGDPSKVVIQDDDGVRLSPRKSFEKWRQVVQSTSYPWKDYELNALTELKTIVRAETEAQLQQVEEQALLNARILRQNEQRYLQLMDISPVAFFTLTKDTIVYCNAQAAELIGEKDPKNMIGRPILDYVQTASRADIKEQLDRMNGELMLLSCSADFVLPDNRTVQLEFTLASVIYQGKPSIMAIGRKAASSEEEEVFTHMTDKLQNYVTTDSLTDMPNQMVFERELLQDWNACLLEEKPISLFIIDIDDFRQYNKIHGLQGGDLCLQYVADVLYVMAQQYQAAITRASGATFMMKLSGSNVEQALALAEEIRQGVMALHIQRDQSVSDEVVTVSVGVTVIIPSSTLHPDDLIVRARKALYEAKNQGKNQVVVR